jgi:hypothetical protein
MTLAGLLTVLVGLREFTSEFIIHRFVGGLVYRYGVGHGLLGAHDMASGKGTSRATRTVMRPGTKHFVPSARFKVAALLNASAGAIGAKVEER